MARRNSCSVTGKCSESRQMARGSGDKNKHNYHGKEVTPLHKKNRAWVQNETLQ